MIKKLSIVFIFSVSLFANLTIEKGEHFSLTPEENLSIEGSLKISQKAVFTAKEECYIALEGDWINRGKFASSTSTVRFTGDGVSTIFGENSFYSFVSYKSLTFESNVVQEIIDRFVVHDADINSTVEGVWSILNLATTQVIDLDSLSVKDSKIIGRAEALNPPNSIDNGNNILWFSTNDDEEETDSGYDWLIKKEDSSKHTIKYTVKKEDRKSEVVIQNELNVATTLDEKNKVVRFEYRAVADADLECSKNAVVMLDENATIKSGFRGCSYEDPTLENWDDFKNAKVVIEDLGNKNSKSVIIIEVNLTVPLIIGGVDVK